MLTNRRAPSIVLTFIALLSIVGLFAGCGSAGSSSGGGTSSNTITLWSRDSDAALVQTIAKAYNASHKTQLKLNIIPAAQFVSKFGTAVASGEVPDLVATDLIFSPYFASTNELTDITSFAQSLPYFDKLDQAHVRLGTYKGKIYALPFSTDGSFLVYNKGLFRQAGLDPNKPPTTWAEIEADAKKITALGNGIHGYYFSGACPGCMIFTFLPYIWADGGDVLNADGTQATIASSPAVKAGLQFYRRLWTDGVVDPGAKVDNGASFFSTFETGKVGIQGTGAFALATLKQQYPNIDFGVTPIPGQNGGSASFAGGDNISIPAGSQHVSQAEDFIKWYLSDQTQVDVVAKFNNIPVRSDLISNKYSQQDPRYITVSEAEAKGKTPYSVHYNELFNDPSGPWLAMLEQAIFSGQVDQAISTAQQRFTQILSSSS
jgi:multiple sugar transport system substrate-binding protein